MSGRRRWVRILVDLAVLLPLLSILLLRLLVYRPVQVAQHSMEPTLQPADQLLVNTWHAKKRLPPRGQIIVLLSPKDGEWLVKRVIGLPGEQVAVGPAGVRINGKLLAEPYAQPFRGERLPLVTVPPDSVYVLGDNRPRSDDSRDFGPVPRSALVGEAVAVLAPRPSRRWLAPQPPR
ncbi:MAG: signal peptidase I [Fimbriimonadaceae bacterium]|nr:signal peptidase I [Fimbriimonadaceae bacterium]